MRSWLQNLYQHFKNHSRIKTPTLLQMEAVECGAAALGIILGYYHRYVPLEELRVDCGVSRDGSKAINMLKAARSYGLEAFGARAEPKDLKSITLPCIVFWEFDHFVVVEDIQADSVYINDPAMGRRTLSPHEFDKAFTGIVLIFKPGPLFKPGGERLSIIKSLQERLKNNYDAIQFIVFISLTLIIPGIIIPGITKIFIDNVLAKGMHSWLQLLLIALCLTGLLRGVLFAIQQYHLIRLHMKLMLTSSAKFVWHIFRLPLAFFEQRYIGDIQNRIESNDHMSSLAATEVSSSMVGLITIIFYAIVMFFYDYRLTLIGIFASLCNAILLYLISERLTNVSRLLIQEEGKLSGIEMSGLAAIETIKSCGLDDHLFKKLTGNHAKIIQAEQKIFFYHQILSVLPYFITAFSGILILGLGSYWIIKGELTVGTLIAFQILLYNFEEPLKILLETSTKIQEVKGEITRLDDVFHHKEDLRFKIQEGILNTPHLDNPLLEIRDVTFGYSELDPPFIQNFSLQLKAGQHIVLVGKTGCGKSTIAKLIAGLYTPWSGEIKIHGQPLKNISIEALSKIINMVEQDIVLFEGTVRDNLTLWDNHIPLSDLEIAAKDALIYSVLQGREHFFESAVSMNGQNFSGGERNRIDIARALVQNPEILILDEGTASLDAATEQQILQNIKKRGQALLMITHRLNAIVDADEIIVLENGKIQERGKHEELLALDGTYSKLIKEQDGIRE